MNTLTFLKKLKKKKIEREKTEIELKQVEIKFRKSKTASHKLFGSDSFIKLINNSNNQKMRKSVYDCDGDKQINQENEEIIPDDQFEFNTIFVDMNFLNE